MIVVLDPGHGGDDRGCCYGEIVESRYTLALAHRCREAILASGMDGVGVELTREGDTPMALSARARAARMVRADLVISLHVNAHATEAPRGALVFHRPDHTGRSERVARAIAGAVPEPLRRIRAVWQSSPDDWTRRVHSVIGRHAAPTVLLEVGFASNPHDRAELLRPETQAALALAVVAGVRAGR